MQLVVLESSAAQGRFSTTMRVIFQSKEEQELCMRALNVADRSPQRQADAFFDYIVDAAMPKLRELRVTMERIDASES